MYLYIFYFQFFYLKILYMFKHNEHEKKNSKCILQKVIMFLGLWLLELIIHELKINKLNNSYIMWIICPMYHHFLTRVKIYQTRVETFNESQFFFTFNIITFLFSHFKHKEILYGFYTSFILSSFTPFINGTSSKF